MEQKTKHFGISDVRAAGSKINTTKLGVPLWHWTKVTQNCTTDHGDKSPEGDKNCVRRFLGGVKIITFEIWSFFGPQSSKGEIFFLSLRCQLLAAPKKNFCRISDSLFMCSSRTFQAWGGKWDTLKTWYVLPNQTVLAVLCKACSSPLYAKPRTIKRAGGWASKKVLKILLTIKAKRNKLCYLSGWVASVPAMFLSISRFHVNIFFPQFSGTAERNVPRIFCIIFSRQKSENPTSQLLLERWGPLVNLPHSASRLGHVP